MEERRRTERFRIGCRLPVFDRKTCLFLGLARNISLDGVLLIGDRFLREGEEFDLHFIGDKKYGGSIETEFNVKALVVWSRRQGGQGLFETGFEFSELNHDALVELRAIIDHVK